MASSSPAKMSFNFHKLMLTCKEIYSASFSDQFKKKIMKIDVLVYEKT